MPHIDQVRKKSCPESGSVLSSPEQEKRSGLFMLFKQPIDQIKYYTRLIWRSAAGTRISNLQVLQSQFFRVATGSPRCTGNRKIHEHLGLSFSADHIRALTESLDPMLAGAGNPRIWLLGRHLRWPRVDPSRLKRKLRVTAQQASPGYPYSGCQVLSNTVQLVIFLLPWLRFLPGYNATTRYGLHSPQCVLTVAWLQHSTRPY